MFVATGVDELTGWVRRLSVAPSSFEQVKDHTALASRLRGWVDAVLADLAVAAADYSVQGLGAGVTAVIQDAARMSAQEARTVVRRGALVTAAPVVGAALASGAISTAHADAMAQVVAVASDEARAALVERAGELVGEAEWLTPEDFRKRCAEASRTAEVDGGLSRFERQRQAAKLTRWTNKDTGMKCGRFELDPEWGELVFRAFDAEIGRLFAEQATPAGESTEALLEHLGARALVNLVAHGQADKAMDAAVFVFADIDTVAHGPHEHTMCELSDGTPLPVGTMQRLLCCARIVPVLAGADGEVLKLGRETRLANRAQRRALRAMYRTCALPGCDVTFDRCEIHHVEPYEHLGLTDLENLLPLCWRHHHLVHEGGWGLTMNPRRTVRVTRPDGEEFAVVPLPEVARWAGRRGRSRSSGRSSGGPSPGARGSPSRDGELELSA